MRKDKSIVNKGQTKTSKKVSKYHSVSSDTYNSLLGDLSSLLEDARRSASRTVNAVMTATYWLIGRRMVEFEQRGRDRAEYGTALIKRISADLTSRFGRGFSERNLEKYRAFYLEWKIPPTLSAKTKI